MAYLSADHLHRLMSSHTAYHLAIWNTGLYCASIGLDMPFSDDVVYFHSRQYSFMVPSPESALSGAAAGGE